MPPYFPRSPLRYSRSTVEAFPRTAQYGAAIERPMPTPWRRFLNFLRSL